MSRYCRLFESGDSKSTKRPFSWHEKVDENERVRGCSIGKQSRVLLYFTCNLDADLIVSLFGSPESGKSMIGKCGTATTPLDEASIFTTTILHHL